MLNILKRIFGIFSPYVNSFERKVDRFFRGIKSTDNIAKIRKKLLELMQRDLIIVNVWLEKKFKGYKYLSKGTRRKMYANVEKIKQAFELHRKDNPASLEKVKNLIQGKGLQFPHGDEAQVKYLAEIMNFLKPGKYYHYIKTASFGKLLRDPANAKMEGDCNQIVTLYIYLFSLKFPLDELKIKILPGHVCLHFREVDIEATTGEFSKYTKFESVLPATEIISTNLLDLADFREDVQEISPRVILKSSQLAYAISSLKTLVAKNLNIAYRNLGISSMDANDFKTAIFYLEKAGDRDALNAAYHNSAVYYLKRDNFSKAELYAGKSGERDLIESVKKAEAGYEYNRLVKKVSGVKTVQDAKRYKATYKKMLQLARKLGDEKLERNLRETLNKL